MSSTDCARVLVAQLIAQGVREIVLCPGSRSAPLALASFEADAAGLCRLHVRLDERSAGFLALGLAKASGLPVAVVTTSGTAAGELLPAVMEAHHSGIPLLVATADRPAALVGFGANQTTDQVGLFGGFVRLAVRIASTSSLDAVAAQVARAVVVAAQASGPVHLNVELEAPLVDPGEVGAWPLVTALVDARSALAEPLRLEPGPRTVVIAGDATPELGRRAAAFAAAAALPLMAEPSSNARCGDALACGRLLLDGPLAAEVERVIVFGHPTLSRPVMALLARPDVEVVAVESRGDWADPGWRVRTVCSGVAQDADDGAWLGRWRNADAAAAVWVDEVVAESESESGLSGWGVARAVWAASAGQALVIGASQLARDLDLVPISSEPPTAYANRGLAGIDGTVSTAVGIALHRGRPTTLLCGDLTFIHDSNALAIGPGEPRPDLRIVVADDSGGAIFSTLEYGQERFAESFERVFATPTGLDCAVLAAAYGVRVREVGTRETLAEALAGPVSGMEVVVMRLDRGRRRALDARIRAFPASSGCN